MRSPQRRRIDHYSRSDECPVLAARNILRLGNKKFEKYEQFGGVQSSRARAILLDGLGCHCFVSPRINPV
jgi:hypothetical protein